MFIRKYVYQFFFFNGGAMGIFEKIVLRSRYKLYISENSIITSMHIKRIVKDIHVFASSFDITDIVENEKKKYNHWSSYSSFIGLICQL